MIRIPAEAACNSLARNSLAAWIALAYCWMPNPIPALADPFQGHGEAVKGR
jgi:hypothetical protein